MFIFAYLEHFVFWVTSVSPRAPLQNHSLINVTCNMQMNIFCSLCFFFLLLVACFLFWITSGHPLLNSYPVHILLETCKWISIIFCSLHFSDLLHIVGYKTHVKKTILGLKIGSKLRNTGVPVEYHILFSLEPSIKREQMARLAPMRF